MFFIISTLVTVYRLPPELYNGCLDFILLLLHLIYTTVKNLKNLSKHCQVIVAFEAWHPIDSFFPPSPTLPLSLSAFPSLHFQTASPIKMTYFFLIALTLTSLAFLRQFSYIHCKSIWKSSIFFLYPSTRSINSSSG